MSLRDGKDSYILKIAQRGNASLQKEYETLLKLKKFSKIYNFYIPKIYSNKKIKSINLKNNFHFLQKKHSDFSSRKADECISPNVQSITHDFPT